MKKSWPTDPWTYNSSHLDHWIIAAANCSSNIYAEDRAGCKATRWAEHLRACASCDQQEQARREEREVK